MRLSKNICTIISSLLLAVIVIVMPYRAMAANEPQVLIITSYNPDIQSTAATLSAFTEAQESMGEEAEVIVESLNCLAYSEAKTWKERMTAILSKHSGENAPDAVVVLGQEAWSAFLSQENPAFRQLPVFCGMVSRNTILTPPDSVDLATWEPDTKDLLRDFPDFNLAGGYYYQYRLQENIGLVKRLYPNSHELVFLSDNSFGGVNMQAMVKKELGRYPDYVFEFLDGRVQPLLEVSDRIGNLSPHSVLLCGTWRVGPSDDFVLKSTTYVLRDANQLLPVFTISSVGLGHWALGGFVPDYRNVGADLAHQVFNYINSGGKSALGPQPIDGKYIFDRQRMDLLEVDEEALPEESQIINNPETFWSKYKYEIITAIVVFIALVVCLIGSIVYIRYIRRLKVKLEQQSGELAKAKDEAEKASEMKTKFIQNIHHEIRTPLNAIVGFSQVVSNSNSGQMQKYADIIERNSNDLLKLIGDVVELSNLDSQTEFEKPQTTVISDLCRLAYRQVESKQADGVEFIFIPPTDDRPRRIYRHMVELVIVNLLHNAFKFTIGGSVTLHCESLPGGKEMRCTVTDTGYGIPADKREFVFQRFTKLDEFKLGGGLGLAICRAVADRIGGSVVIDPDYTTGTRIIFTFPVLDPS